MSSGRSWSGCRRRRPGTRGAGGGRSIRAGRLSTRSSTSCGAGVRGGSCRRTSRRGRRCTGTSCGGRSSRRPRRCWTRCGPSCGAGEGRDPEPTAGIIDSQSVKGADTVARESRGYDAGEKVNGRKRFIVTDTLGLLVVMVCAANVHDRDGGRRVLIRLTDHRRRTRHIFADAGFAGRAGRLGRRDPTDDGRGRPQGRRTARVLRPTPTVGCGAHPGLDHRPPPPGQRLRAPPGELRSDDPLGSDQHHDSAGHPRPPRHTSRPPSPRIPRLTKISNTLRTNGSGGRVGRGWSGSISSAVSTGQRTTGIC